LIRSAILQDRWLNGLFPSNPSDTPYDLVDKAGWTICLADAPKFNREISALGPFCYIRRHDATAR
jgi:hypothetical protein